MASGEWLNKFFLGIPSLAGCALASLVVVLFWFFVVSDLVCVVWWFFFRGSRGCFRLARVLS